MEQSQKIRVLIVDDIAETRENLRKLLSFDPDIMVVGAAGTGEEGVQLAKETSPNVVLMDINLPGIDGITATEQIVRNNPAAQIIILSVQGETGYMRRAMAAGARDFLVKPPSGDELMTTIRRAYQIGKDQAARIAVPSAGAPGAPGGPRGARKRGHLITIFSPKGGVGCTTVAINLAISLQTRLGTSQRIALMDGNLQFGDVAVMLNLQPARTIGDLAGRMDELDSDLLTSVITAHPSGVKALLAPPRPEMAEELLMGSEGSGSNRNIQTVLREMTKEFDLVIGDTWSWMDGVTLSMLDEAALILIVITPLLSSIKDARNFIDLANQLDYPMEKLALVINHADRRTGIQIPQIEQVLMPSLAHIPYGDLVGPVTANRGLILVTEEPRHPISQAFVQLTAAVLERLEELIGEEEEEEVESAAEDSRRILGRIFG